MIQTETRTPNAREKKLLEGQARRHEANRARLVRDLRKLPILAFLVPLLYVLGRWIKGQGLGTGLAFLVGFVILGLLLIWPRTMRDFRSRAERVREVARSGRVESMRWSSEEVLAFEEIEDEGADWCFLVESGKLLYLGGQEHYETSRFPSSECELVCARDATGEIVYFHMFCTGHKLCPTRVVPASVKRGLELPESPTVLDGRLEDIERLFAPRGSSG